MGGHLSQNCTGFHSSFCYLYKLCLQKCLSELMLQGHRHSSVVNVDFTENVWIRLGEVDMGQDPSKQFKKLILTVIFRKNHAAILCEFAYWLQTDDD